MTAGVFPQMKLYSVHTTVKEHRGCKDVRFAWLRSGGNTERPYAKLIEDYDPKDKDAAYAEGAVDELFTAIEAGALREYLDNHHGDTGVTTIDPADLPIAKNVFPLSAMSVGGGDDFYQLYEEPKYSLPFKVMGYFNLVGCELVGEPGETFRHYLHILSEHGVRQESQEEARRREAKEITPGHA